MYIFFTKKEKVENNVSFEVFEIRYPKLMSLVSLSLLFMWLFFIQKHQLGFALLVFILMFGMILFQIIEIKYFNILKKKKAGKKVVVKNSLFGIAEIQVEK
jgi:4-hydroxybenzoate polyprenyltransferase